MGSLSSAIVEFNLATRAFQKLSFSDFQLVLTDKNKIYWIHCDLKKPNDLTQISQQLELPDIVVKTCKEQSSLPVLFEDDISLTIQTECLLTTKYKQTDVSFGNLILYLTDHYCFTASRHPLPALMSFQESYSKAIKYAKTPCFILFLILDNTLNDFSRLLLEYELIADQIDLKIRDTQENIYNEVMTIKKQVIKIQHHIASIRDLLMRISGRKVAAISEACRKSLGNALEHSQIIFNEADTIREILKNSLEQMDNTLMQKMNNTMKVLTAFASFFLPLSLIAGIYGMNFVWIPELHWQYGYFWALGLMFFIVILMVYIFRRNKWF